MTEPGNKARIKEINNILFKCRENLGLGHNMILCSIFMYIENTKHAKLNENTAHQELQWNLSKLDATGITPACPEHGRIRLLFIQQLLEIKSTHHV